jgi:acetyl-CoA C-acetyltransferase
MFLDGLEDAYDKGRLMGTFAEDCAEAFQFTREAQDDYALARCPNALGAHRGRRLRRRGRAGDGEDPARARRTVEDEQPGKRAPTRSRT